MSDKWAIACGVLAVIVLVGFAALVVVAGWQSVVAT
jgi:TRAP-type C4-dicarboxylate transport system permease small subunit